MRGRLESLPVKFTWPNDWWKITWRILFVRLNAVRHNNLKWKNQNVRIAGMRFGIGLVSKDQVVAHAVEVRLYRLHDFQSWPNSLKARREVKNSEQESYSFWKDLQESFLD